MPPCWESSPILRRPITTGNGISAAPSYADGVSLPADNTPAMVVSPVPVKNPLVIVGPTASGKTALALAIAQSCPNVEVVSADAMAVYRGMDIGTAKPTLTERAAVPHHLVDVVGLGEDYTVTRFQAEARTAIDGIESRGASAIVVGGTGLYVRALVDDFSIPDQYPDVRRELESDPDTVGLWNRLQHMDPAAAEKMLPSNRRRIVRALEVTIGSGRPFSSFGPGVDRYGATRFVQVGLEIDRDLLDRRIDERYDEQLATGLLDEIERLRASAGPQGWSRTASQALGYRELSSHLDGLLSLDEALDEARRRTKRFARRQQRWFRRDPRITWFDATTADLGQQIVQHWKDDGLRASGSSR